MLGLFRQKFRSSLPLNVLFLLAVSFVLFYRHSVYLAEGYDARTYILFVEDYFRWTAPEVSFSWNPMQGMGLTSIFEAYLVPGFFPLLLDVSARYQKVFCYMVFAVQFFLSVYLLLFSLDIPEKFRALASWVVVLFVFPLHFHPIPLGTTYVIYFPAAHSYSVAIILLGLFRLVGRRSTRENILILALFTAMATVLCLSAFAAVPIVAPMLLLGGLFLLGASGDRREVMFKVAAVGSALGMLVVTGVAAWILGEVLFCARFTLNPEFLDNHPGPVFTSIWFSGTMITRAVMILALFGSILMMRSRDKALRLCGGFLLSYMLIIVVAAYFYLQQVDTRKMLRPIYYEYPFLAFYALSAFYALARGVAYVLRVFPKLHSERKLAKPLVAFGVLYVAAMSFSTFVLKKDRPEAVIPSDTGITRRLVAETAAPAGANYRGRTVWLTTWADPGGPKGEGTTVTAGGPGLRAMDLSQLDASHTALEVYLLKNIPTLDCYNQTLSLPFYLVSSRLASQASWGTNFTYFSSANVPLLQAMGVRFVMASRQLSEPGIVLAAYELVGGGVVTESRGAVLGDHPLPPKQKDQGQFLYELPQANLGQYSPTAVIYARSLQESLDVMGTAGFDYTRQVVLNDPLPLEKGLVPGALESLTLIRGGLRLAASTTGQSLLLLPFEYMNGMRWIPDDNRQGQVQIVRANLVMTGLIFQGRIAGTLDCAPGLFRGGFSRMKDYTDMKRLDLGALKRHDLRGADAFYPSFMP